MRWDAIMTVMWEGAECSRIPSMPGFCIYATIAMVAAPLILGGNLKFQTKRTEEDLSKKLNLGGGGGGGRKAKFKGGSKILGGAYEHSW